MKAVISMRHRLSENCPGRLVNGRVLKEPEIMPY